MMNWRRRYSHRVNEAYWAIYFETTRGRPPTRAGVHAIFWQVALRESLDDKIWRKKNGALANQKCREAIDRLVEDIRQKAENIPQNVQIDPSSRQRSISG